MSAGYLASNPVSFLLMKETGRLVDTTGDFRVTLSVAACGFILFGLVAAVAGLASGRRRAMRLPDAKTALPIMTPSSVEALTQSGRAQAIEVLYKVLYSDRE